MPTKFDLDRVVRSSVQEPGDVGYQPVVFMLATAADEITRWWSPIRDRELREFWPTESFLAGTLYSVAARNAAFRFELKGALRQVRMCQRMLNQVDFGHGWQHFIMKLSIDLLCQDNGAFIEVIRPTRVTTKDGTFPATKSLQGDWCAVGRNGALLPLDGVDYKLKDSPLEQPLALAHLDSGRCLRTGDPDYPIIYTDRKGVQHKMRWWQVITIEDMPSPIESMNNVGYSAVTRVLRASQILRDIAIYKHEKVSGRFARAVHITNVRAEAVMDAIKEHEAHADSSGLSRYTQPIITNVLDPNATPGLVTIELASLPDGFDEEETLRWYIANLALGFGVDYGFLAPLPGQGLGTATQSEVQSRHARSKSSALFMKTLEGKFNFGGILPKSVYFEFKEVDPEEEQERDEARRRRAETRKIRIESTEITPQIARQIASDDGDLDQRYLAQLGEEDVTPDVTIEGREPMATDRPREIAEEAKPPEEKARRFWSIARWRGKQDDGKVHPKGKPLSPWGDEPVEITAEDIARAVGKWDARMPEEAKGILTARAATAEEERQAEEDYELSSEQSAVSSERTT